MHYAAKKMKKMSLKMKKMSLKIQKSSLLYTEISLLYTNLHFCILKSSLLYTEISLLYTERSMHIIMLLFPKGRQKVIKKRLGLWRPAGGLSNFKASQSAARVEKILKPSYKIFDPYKYLKLSVGGLKLSVRGGTDTF